MDNINEIKIYLEAMGFNLKDGASELIYQKKYKKHNDYEINVQLNEDDLKLSKISYGNKIKYGRETTSGLYQKETFVVLECINRLLDKGYSPEEIILEKDYPSGLKEKGQWLDILVNKDGLPYYMIECKRYGKQYDEAHKDTKTDGGQILTYYTNDRDVKKVVLYASRLHDKKIEYKNAIIDTSNFKGSNKKVIFNTDWNKNFDDTGLFEKNIAPYEIKTVGITKAKLADIKEDNTLYNAFARILRKYAVSDLTNAYNKLFNLLLCKIVDEDNAGNNCNYEMQFQWKQNENAYDVLDKISNLYDEGVKRYLSFKVTDYSKESIENEIKNISDEATRKLLLLKFNELRFEKNNEFAFIDVFNKDTFKENSLILKEVIKLFQVHQIKYSDKQQFLGDFFERLLNIGIKQTEGQFFTPIPIANFIVNSIPFEKIIEENLNTNNNNFLPYIIDYACGAGHFLTEYMHRIDKLFSQVFEQKCKTRQQQDNFESWKKNYKWAKEFVYGIEKDYRLTKTSKIACFLNGDGDANIVTASGLDSFNSYKYLNTILYQNEEEYCRDNPVFNCVIANPPYSVQDFKDTLKTSTEESYGEQNFELFKYLGDNSDDIECLFMERTKQLLKENGYAAIVISSSFLTNGGIHQKTRELIMNNFKIKAIVELGAGAFMATGTNTVVLFMQKRNSNELKEVMKYLNKFYTDYKDFNYKGSPEILKTFVKEMYIDITLDDYISLLKNKPNKSLLENELFEEYYDKSLSTLENNISKIKNVKKKNELEKLYNQLKNDKSKIDLAELIKTEKQKLENYLINFAIKTIIVKAGEDKEEIATFLGYKFSKRKGDEGLKELKPEYLKTLNSYSDRSAIQSKLYNNTKLLDDTKVNYYIYKNFESDLSQCEIDKIKKNGLNHHVLYCDLNDLIDFSNIDFDKSISMESKKKILIESKYPLEKMKSISDISMGVTYKKTDVTKEKTSNAILTSDNITLENKLEIKKTIYLKKEKTLDPNKKLLKNDIFITMSSGSKSHIGKVAFIEENIDYYSGGFMGIIRPNNPQEILPKYLYHMLSHKDIRHNVKLLSNGNNINNLSSRLNHLRIPIIKDTDIQQKLLDEMNLIDINKSLKEKKIKENNEKIKNIFKNEKNITPKKLSEVIGLEYGISLTEENRIDGEYPVYGSNGIVGFHNEFKVKGPGIIIGRKGSVGKLNWSNDNFTPIDTTFYVVQKDTSIDLKILFHLLNSLDLEKMRKGLGSGGVNRNKILVRKVNIPKDKVGILKMLTPLEKEIEDLQKELAEVPNQRQAILDNYLV